MKNSDSGDTPKTEITDVHSNKEKQNKKNDIQRRSKLRNILSEGSISNLKKISSSFNVIANDLKVRTYQIDEKKLYSNACCDENSA